jgi:hypothetical protein
MDTRLQLRCEMGKQTSAVGRELDRPQIDVDPVIFSMKHVDVQAAG